MVDIVDVRSRPEVYQDSCLKKRIAFDVYSFLELDEKRSAKLKNVEELKAKLNALSKRVPTLSGEEQLGLKAELKKLSVAAKSLDSDFQQLNEEWNKAQLLIPAIPLPDVPNGKDDTENVEVKRVGTIPSFSFPLRDHIELSEGLGLFDIERGVKLAGSRNYFLTGMGSRLHHAVLHCALDFITERGFSLMDPPHIVNYDAMAGTGYFPGGEDMAYHLDERDDMYLIGTSEVPVAAYHMGETLNFDDLPKRYAGYSPCYRREAGTYGKDTRGLYRVHQFYKVEQVVVCENSEQVSRSFHEELLKNSEDFLTALGLPYRVVVVCTGDMGQGQIFKHDIETWMPSRDAYSETHSCSTLHDFQARRLKLRYKKGDGKPLYCHTLNNTLIASPRVLIPLLETNQLADGSIKIPDILQPYMGGLKVLEPKE